jgi:hypothetical protein
MIYGQTILGDAMAPPRQQVRLWWEMRSAVLDQMVEEARGGIEARRRPGQISVCVSNVVKTINHPPNHHKWVV